MLIGPVWESFTGAWQRGVVVDSDTGLLRNSAIYACVTGIASDVSKMRIKLEWNDGGIWEEVTANAPWLPVLRKPNHFQNRIKFLEQWTLSKLLWGNAYVLKERDDRTVVNALYVLDPRRVTPLVTEEGDVYYQVGQDPLSHVEETGVIVPAREVIHDMMPSLWHPLVGVPPIYACAMAATLANKSASSSTSHFSNRAMPGGILTAPGQIPKPQADNPRRFRGTARANAGRIAVMGGGLSSAITA
jgi:HK97 family phage portal protein